MGTPGEPDIVAVVDVQHDISNHLDDFELHQQPDSHYASDSIHDDAAVPSNFDLDGSDVAG